MAEIKKVATRAGFGSALVELGAERDDFVVLDADLAAATQTGMFKKAYPERFYDCVMYSGYGQKGDLQLVCNVCGGQSLRAGEKLGRLPAPQRYYRRDPRGNFRR